MYVIKDNVIKLSVRGLVEFICRSGDIDNRTGGFSDVRLMQEGTRMHKKIQKSMGASYRAEVPLKIELPETVDDIDYIIRLEGRADGIISDFHEEADGSKTPVGKVIIDEIKTMQSDVEKLEQPVPVHEAQAKVYGYIYMVQNHLSGIGVQMTYANPETEKIKRFTKEYSKEELTEWFETLINSFKRWSDFVFCEREKRTASIKKLSFPFEYRKGQKKMVTGVYHCIGEARNLFIQASTGVGKTISTIYPAVCAMGQSKADKIFYLTSKTITRTVAEETFSILRRQGLSMRTVTLTAKDKICILEERNCNPVKCERAAGHFDRINDAVYDMITHEMVIDREKVMEYAKKHCVCPFEMSLDISYWCDGIICDYNYVFDPNVALKRYFGEGNRGEYIFLVDEAHNLVDRARQMYSAILVKEDFLTIKKYVKDTDRALYNSLEKCNAGLLEYKRKCDTIDVIDYLGTFPAALERCYVRLQHFLEHHKNHPQQEEILQFFFTLRHFLNMYDCMDEKYLIYTKHDENNHFYMKLFCVDPSTNLSERLAQGRSAVFFSATLLPVNYFKEMLTADTQDYAVYAQSSFDSKKRRIVIGKDVSSRYTRRNAGEYRKVCRYIAETVQVHPGRYLVFFPSYGYLQQVKENYEQMYKPDEIIMGAEGGTPKLTAEQNLIVQLPSMKEQEKENFLSLFENVQGSGSLLGFCVMGGIFSEGIDLKRESLIGTIIVGTGIPMISKERNLLRDYFDGCGKDGYAYAYVYPGMNKVLQSAGRVIRTEEDCGVIILLDDRFLTPGYEKLYPREWNEVYPATKHNFKNILADFWKNLVQ